MDLQIVLTKNKEYKLIEYTELMIHLRYLNDPYANQKKNDRDNTREKYTYQGGNLWKILVVVIQI